MKLSSQLSIGLATNSDRLYLGDILVTRSNTINSNGIAFFTDSPVSHAALVVDDLYVVEAIPGKVSRTELARLNDVSTIIFHLRHKELLYAHGLKIAEYALAQVNKAYDMKGALMAGSAAGCNTKQSLGCMLMKTVGENLTDEQHDEAFFCSELIGRAYESVGLKLVKDRPWLTLPGGLLKSDQLVVMKRIK